MANKIAVVAVAPAHVPVVAWCAADGAKTIDDGVQRVVAEALTRHADTNDTGVVWAAVVSVKDGALLAMADCGGDKEAPRPFAATRVFEPGHLMSPLIVAAAFDANVAKPESILFASAFEGFYCQPKPSGDCGYIWESLLSVSNGLVYSSEIVMSKLSALLGPERAYSAFTRFGIGRKTGIEGEKERIGRLRPPDKWSREEWTMAALGHGAEVNCLQIARAYAALANHGHCVELQNAGMTQEADAEEAVQAVSANAADCVRSILEGAIDAEDVNGFGAVDQETIKSLSRCLAKPMATGRRAAVDGVRVAGMTSTSPRAKPDGREYETDRFVAGFAGFFPADAPEFVVVVCFETRRVDGAPLLHQGGWRPALAFADIVRGIVEIEKETEGRIR